MLSPCIVSHTQVPPNLNLPGDHLIPVPASPLFPHHPFQPHPGEFTSPVSALPPTVPHSVTPTFPCLLDACFCPIHFDRIQASLPHQILTEFALPVFTLPPHSFIWSLSISTASGQVRLTGSWQSSPCQCLPHPHLPLFGWCPFTPCPFRPHLD